VPELAQAFGETGHVFIDVVRLRPGERSHQADAQGSHSSPLRIAVP
jgi:hypothetical protein